MLNFPISLRAGGNGGHGGAGICRGLAETLRVAPGGGGGLPYLPIDIFAVFNGEHVQPLGTDTAVENAIGPDAIGPDLVFLKLPLERLAVERMFRQMTEGFFDSFSRGFVKRLEVFEGLRCETDLPH